MKFLTSIRDFLRDNITSLAVPLVAVLVLHADAAQMGVLVAASWAPNLLFSLHAGAFVDRFDRLLQANADWATIGLRDAAGNVVAHRTRSGLPPVPPPPAEAGADDRGPLF